MKRIFTKYSFIALLSALVVLSSCVDNDIDVFDSAEQLQTELDDIDAYLDLYGLTAETDTVTDQLRYIVYQSGDGDVAGTDDIALISLTGRVLNGDTFYEDDSLYIARNGWVAGFYYLLPYIQEGGSMTMFIPSYYGYGQNASFSGDLPANSTMKLEVELKKVYTEFEYEQSLVDIYLEENELVAETDSVYGLKYIIEQAGDGVTYPSSTSTVNVDYVGYVLFDNDAFGASEDLDLDLSDLIEGWQILMPYVSEGGKITMFIPSEYAYGSTGNGTIPAYSTLKFEVTLNEVK